MELWRKVNVVAEKLGLGLWHLTIDERPEESTADEDYATIHVEEMDAKIVFYRAYYEADSFMQLHVIVHELMHCVFATLDDALESLPELIVQIVEHGDKDTRLALAELFFDAVSVQFERRVDRLIDQVARVVVRLDENPGLDS